MTHSRHGVHKSMKMLLEATIPLRFHVNDAAERPLLEFIRLKKVDIDETELFITPNDAEISYPTFCNSEAQKSVKYVFRWTRQP